MSDIRTLLKKRDNIDAKIEAQIGYCPVCKIKENARREDGPAPRGNFSRRTCALCGNTYPSGVVSSCSCRYEREWRSREAQEWLRAEKMTCEWHDPRNFKEKRVYDVWGYFQERNKDE